MFNLFLILITVLDSGFDDESKERKSLTSIDEKL